MHGDSTTTVLRNGYVYSSMCFMTQTPSKTHLGARTRPDPQNDSKMEPPTPKNDAPDPSFWIDFGENFGYFWAHSSIRFKIKIQKQTQNQIQNQKTKVETN